MKIDPLAKIIKMHSYNLGFKTASQSYGVMKETLKAYKGDEFFYQGFKDGIKITKMNKTKIKIPPLKEWDILKNLW